MCLPRSWGRGGLGGLSEGQSQRQLPKIGGEVTAWCLQRPWALQDPQPDRALCRLAATTTMGSCVGRGIFLGCQPSRVWQSLDALGEGARIGMHIPATHKQMQVIRIIRVQPRSLACSIHEWKLRPRLMHCKECTGNVLHFKQIKISAYFFNAC